jgi:hypothetical protein
MPMPLTATFSAGMKPLSDRPRNHVIVSRNFGSL